MRLFTSPDTDSTSDLTDRDRWRWSMQDQRFCLIDKRALFLSGGITGCPDWQQYAIRRLSETDLSIYNPRRPDFPIGDSTAAEKQITWEYQHLSKAGLILFWFCKETIQPIVLLELGLYMREPNRHIFIGVHPDYSRWQDVLIQTFLYRPDLTIKVSLDAICDDVLEYLKNPI